MNPGIQGGTTDEYYHLTSAQLTNLLSKAADETVAGAWTFPNLTVGGHISYYPSQVTTAVSRPMVSSDNAKLIAVTAASTQTLPLSSTLTTNWHCIVDNQIAAGGTVTFAKNAGDTTGIIKHVGATADTPLLATKYEACTIWWDGTNFHIRGPIT